MTSSFLHLQAEIQSTLIYLWNKHTHIIVLKFYTDIMFFFSSLLNKLVNWDTYTKWFFIAWAEFLRVWNTIKGTINWVIGIHKHNGCVLHKYDSGSLKYYQNNWCLKIILKLEMRKRRTTWTYFFVVCATFQTSDTKRFRIYERMNDILWPVENYCYFECILQKCGPKKLK